VENITNRLDQAKGGNLEIKDKVEELLHSERNEEKNKQL
jgi:hypothetical protein